MALGDLGDECDKEEEDGAAAGVRTTPTSAQKQKDDDAPNPSPTVTPTADSPHGKQNSSAAGRKGAAAAAAATSGKATTTSQRRKTPRSPPPATQPQTTTTNAVGKAEGGGAILVGLVRTPHATPIHISTPNKNTTEGDVSPSKTNANMSADEFKRRIARSEKEEPLSSENNKRTDATETQQSSAPLVASGQEVVSEAEEVLSPSKPKAAKGTAGRPTAGTRQRTAGAAVSVTSPNASPPPSPGKKSAILRPKKKNALINAPTAPVNAVPSEAESAAVSSALPTQPQPQPQPQPQSILKKGSIAAPLQLFSAAVSFGDRCSSDAVPPLASQQLQPQQVDGPQAAANGEGPPETVTANGAGGGATVRFDTSVTIDTTARPTSSSGDDNYDNVNKAAGNTSSVGKAAAPPSPHHRGKVATSDRFSLFGGSHRLSQSAASRDDSRHANASGSAAAATAAPSLGGGGGRAAGTGARSLSIVSATSLTPSSVPVWNAGGQNGGLIHVTDATTRTTSPASPSTIAANANAANSTSDAFASRSVNYSGAFGGGGGGIGAASNTTSVVFQSDLPNGLNNDMGANEGSLGRSGASPRGAGRDRLRSVASVATNGTTFTAAMSVLNGLTIGGKTPAEYLKKVTAALSRRAAAVGGGGGGSRGSASMALPPYSIPRRTIDIANIAQMAEILQTEVDGLRIALIDDQQRLERKARRRNKIFATDDVEAQLRYAIFEDDDDDEEDFFSSDEEGKEAEGAGLNQSASEDDSDVSSNADEEPAAGSSVALFGWSGMTSLASEAKAHRRESRALALASPGRRRRKASSSSKRKSGAYSSSGADQPHSGRRRQKQQRLTDVDRFRIRKTLERSEKLIAELKGLQSLLNRTIADKNNVKDDLQAQIEGEITDCETVMIRTNAEIRKAKMARKDLVTRYWEWRKSLEIGDWRAGATFYQDLQQGPKQKEVGTQVEIQSETLPLHLRRFVKLMKQEGDLNSRLVWLELKISELDSITARIEAELVCPICRCYFTNPVLMRPCGHAYCQSCFEHSRELRVFPDDASVLQCTVCGTVVTEPASIADHLLPEVYGKVAVRHVGYTDVRQCLRAVKIALARVNQRSVKRGMSEMSAAILAQHMADEGVASDGSPIGEAPPPPAPSPVAASLLQHHQQMQRGGAARQ